jgi:hypothetical protein
MSLRDKIKQTEENIRRFRQEEEHKLLLELQIEEGILVNRLLEREEQIREMLAKLQQEEDREEQIREMLAELQQEEEMDGLSEPISQDRIEQRRRIYDGLEHIQDYEVRLLKELREKIDMIKSPDHVEEEQRRQDVLQRRQEEEQRRQDELQRRQEEEQRQVALYRRRQDELRRQNELQRRQEEVRRQDVRKRKEDEINREKNMRRSPDQIRKYLNHMYSRDEEVPLIETVVYRVMSQPVSSYNEADRIFAEVQEDEINREKNMRRSPDQIRKYLNHMYSRDEEVPLIETVVYRVMSQPVSSYNEADRIFAEVQENHNRLDERGQESDDGGNS